MAQVNVPGPLQKLTGGISQIEVNGTTVQDVLRNMDTSYPGFGAKLFNDEGMLNIYVNIFVDEKDIRFAKGLATPVKPSSQVLILTAIAGG